MNKRQAGTSTHKPDIFDLPGLDCGIRTHSGQLQSGGHSAASGDVAN